MICPWCNGFGSTAEHAPNCNCNTWSPSPTFPVQVECERCEGTGNYPPKRDEDTGEEE